MDGEAIAECDRRRHCGIAAEGDIAIKIDRTVSIKAMTKSADGGEAGGA